MKAHIVKLITFVFSFLFISQILHAAPLETKNLSKLVDIAGQQRMYVHQVLVSYAQVGQVQSFGNPISTKLNAIKKFEANLNTLNKELSINTYISTMDTIWHKLKDIALAPPKRTNMTQLIEYNEAIVALSNSIIAHLVNNSEKNIINISGKQRMLSQRIALFMLMENWGFKNNYAVQMQVGLAQFSLNLNFLQKNKNNTAKINKVLKSLQNDYNSLVKITGQDKMNRDYSFAIARHTSQMLRKAKNTTKLYVKLDNEEIYIKQSAYEELAKIN